MIEEASRRIHLYGVHFDIMRQSPIAQKKLQELGIEKISIIISSQQREYSTRVTI